MTTRNRKRTYEEWKTEVNKELQSLGFEGLDDLPDAPTARWYDNGVSPKAAAKKAIAWAKTF